MTPVMQTNNVAQSLFDLLISQIRGAIRDELTAFPSKSLAASSGNSKPAGDKWLFSVKDTAAALDVSEVTVRRLIARGLLRPNRALRHLRISREQIEHFANAHE
jgi:excisionase family DNA binding protein